ncbi:MAG TPA: mycothiol synthase [Micromonospora sp.]
MSTWTPQPVAGQPSADVVEQILTLATAAGDTDGAAPLSEQTTLNLRQPGPVPPVHLVVHDPDGTLVGYAQLDPGQGDGQVAELVTHPTHRRRGIGRALARALLDTADTAPTGPLRVWAHGDHPSAAALALDLGFDRVRVLWQLRRRLTDPVPEPVLPDGVRLRAFRPGEDDEAWLRVNRRAFADHPEQGRWTHDDLRVRMSEPWFDPAGFLLAVDGSTDRLLGFHWTKVHGVAEAPDSSPTDPIGEVYVLGVDPETHGGGLGRALTLAGLRHLRDRGLSRAMLYVDESNGAAMALYTRLGFRRWTADVSYQLG